MFSSHFSRPGLWKVLGLALLFLSATSNEGMSAEEQRVIPKVRTITGDQYRNTIADIFGSDISIVGRFDQPVRTDGLLAVGAGLGSMTPASFEQFDTMARSIADQVVSPSRRGTLVPCEPKSTAKADNECAA